LLLLVRACTLQLNLPASPTPVGAFLPARGLRSRTKTRRRFSWQCCCGRDADPTRRDDVPRAPRLPRAWLRPCFSKRFTRAFCSRWSSRAWPMAADWGCRFRRNSPNLWASTLLFCNYFFFLPAFPNDLLGWPCLQLLTSCSKNKVKLKVRSTGVSLRGGSRASSQLQTL